MVETVFIHMVELLNDSLKMINYINYLLQISPFPVAPTPTKMSPKQIIAYPGDQQEIECSVTAARPAVKITWTSNGRDITAHAKAVERHNIHDVRYFFIYFMQYLFNRSDNEE